MADANPATSRTLTIPLDPPLEIEGGKVNQLKLREPTGAEMREAEKAFDVGLSDQSTSEFETRLLCAVASVSEHVCNELPVSVVMRARDFLSQFDIPGDLPNPLPPELDLDLDQPVKSKGGAEYVTISLKEPTFGMRRRAETALRNGRTVASSREFQILIVSQAARLPYDVAEALPISVLSRAEGYLRGFLEPGRMAPTP